MLPQLSLLISLFCAPLVFAQANLPTIPKDKTTPVQQRLSLPAPDSVSVAWNTYEKINNPCVKYGLTENALNQLACSTSSITYPTSRTWSNSVRISGLTPATKYYYQIVSTNSTSDFFQTSRLAGDKTPFTMVTLADLGVVGPDGYTIQGDQTKRDSIPSVQPSLEHTTIANLAKTVESYEFIIHPGDLAYADDWHDTVKNESDGVNAYEAIIEQFYEQLAPISGRKPYLVSPGNHEADCIESSQESTLCPQGQKNFTDFMNRFGQITPRTFPSLSKNQQALQNAKKASSLAVPPFWFSFNYGMVHVTMFDTETDFTNAPDGPGTTLNSGNFGSIGQQLEFLEADLASVDRSITPWIIVAGHRPYYSAGGSGNVCTECQTAFEDVFYKYGVDLAAFGHVHNLQRFAPVHKNVADPAGYTNPKAPMYIVIGGSGNIEGHSSISNPQSYNDFAYNESFGYGTLTFHNSTNMEINFINSVDGSVLDTSMLYKEHSENFVVQS